MLEQYQYKVCEIDATSKPCYKILPPVREKCFSDAEIERLYSVYHLLYPKSEFEIITVSRFYHEGKQIQVNGELFITNQSRSKHSAAILAHWPGVIGIDVQGESPVRVGILSSIIEHSATTKTITSNTITTNRHVFAHVQWLEDHPRRDYLKSPTVISATTYDTDSPANSIPISRIIARCAIVYDCLYQFDYGEDRVCISIPFIKKMCE